MAVLRLPNASGTESSAIDERVEFIVNKNLSADQKKAGVIAKVQVRHPVASFTVTVWTKNGRKWVSEPSQEGKKQWFLLVSLAKEIKDHILYLVENSEEDTSAWYLDMVGEHTINITAEASNPDLGLEAITVDSNLTDKQREKGVVCKVNLVTTIGSFLNYTIWNSKFGESLYGNSPSEGSYNVEEDSKQRGNPGYRLSREATAQVLAYLHPMVDFTQVIAPAAPVNIVTETQTAEMVAEGFQPVGDSMFEATE